MKPRGKSIAISPFRTMVMDLMHFSQQVPAVTIERRMNLAPLIAARLECTPRPMWTSIFIKAYGKVAMQMPVLRRSYMSMPWPRFYEHPKNIANANVLRRVGDEDVVIQCLIRSPENRTLPEIDAKIRHYLEAPVEEIKSYNRVKRMGYLPWPIRRFLFWSTLNWIGRRRCHNVGTFGITSLAERGAGVLNLIPLATSTLHYGMFDEKGCIDMRYAIDHRVLDGVAAADALARMEETLLGEILDEVKGLAGARGVTRPRLAA